MTHNTQLNVSKITQHGQYLGHLAFIQVITEVYTDLQFKVGKQCGHLKSIPLRHLFIIF